jgi:hypothetical protein
MDQEIWTLPRNPEALEGKAVSMDRNLPKLWGVGSIPTAPTNPFHSTALNFLFANKMLLANN